MADVVVVGAGVSGLAAAWRLQQEGVHAVVLEAREAVGGRTIHPDGSDVDLGASWVWDTEQHVHHLLRELGLKTFPHHTEGLDTYDDGLELQRGRLPRSAVAERRIVGGAHRIATELAARVRGVRTGRAVRAIRIDGDSLMVETDEASWRADHVLVGVAPALFAQSVDLPDLPAETRAFLASTPTWMADIAKVVVLYERRFWRDAGWSGRAASRIGPLAEIHDLSGPDGADPALFGFVPRTLATRGWRKRILPQLAHLFGPGAADPLAMHIKPWWEEPTLYKARSPKPVPSRMGHAALREPLLGGRLQLIATETSAESPGHLDGAVERAEAAVAAIAKRRAGNAR